MALATSAHLYLEGRITGISGMLYKSIHMIDFNYTYSFMAGMLFASSYVKSFSDPSKNKKSRTFFEPSSKYVSDLSLLGFIIAGLLVGFGAKMGNGCTSAHGICGIPRFSKRSIIAICLFMVFGSAVATIRYYHPFLQPIIKVGLDFSFLSYILLLVSIAGIAYLLYESYKTGKTDNVRDTIVAFAIGASFSYGLIESGMLQRHVVIAFLTIGRVWNWQLAFVLGSAVGVNIFTFKYILTKCSKPLFKSKFDLPSNTKVDNKLLVGASIFGIGWGLSGICPGPAALAFYIYCPQSLLFFAAVCGGIYLESKYDKQITDFVNKNAILSSINVFDKKKK
ncbi:hypothetical protein PIROE2DRAFT_61920 [Piromyces sp. E2]|nr:hypothetical protein PIROE2DRAFT_61920 [Piromyces sp. E2]|eukprot:OUM62404.1 hypothetical protein PIROE2DRAFT_61920 [Piromyces sp. E2]